MHRQVGIFKEEKESSLASENLYKRAGNAAAGKGAGEYACGCGEYL